MREEDMLSRLSKEQLKQFIEEKENHISSSKNMPIKAQMPHLIRHQELSLERAKAELSKRV